MYYGNLPKNKRDLLTLLRNLSGVVAGFSLLSVVYSGIEVDRESLNDYEIVEGKIEEVWEQKRRYSTSYEFRLSLPGDKIRFGILTSLAPRNLVEKVNVGEKATAWVNRSIFSGHTVVQIKTLNSTPLDFKDYLRLKKENSDKAYQEAHIVFPVSIFFLVVLQSVIVLEKRRGKTST